MHSSLTGENELWTAYTQYLLNHIESWSEKADIQYGDQHVRFFSLKSSLRKKRCMIQGFYEYKMVNYYQIKQIIKAVCVISMSITRWRCDTSRTVPGSIPGSVTGFFSDIFPSDLIMALGSTQSLVKMSTRNILGGKGGRCVRVTTSSPLSVERHENLGA